MFTSLERAQKRRVGGAGGTELLPGMGEALGFIYNMTEREREKTEMTVPGTHSSVLCLPSSSE